MNLVLQEQTADAASIINRTQRLNTKETQRAACTTLRPHTTCNR